MFVVAVRFVSRPSYPPETGSNTPAWKLEMVTERGAGTETASFSSVAFLMKSKRSLMFAMFCINHLHGTKTQGQQTIVKYCRWLI